MFSSGFCEIFKTTNFEEHQKMASSASEALLKIKFLTDFENMFQDVYKDTRVNQFQNLFVVGFEHVFVCFGVFEKQPVGDFKEIYAPAP